MRRLEKKGYRLGRHHPELEAAIVENPKDAAARLVYADWLLEQQDPRGELITRMASGVAFDDLLANHPWQLAPDWMKPMELEWWLGYVRKVHCRACQDGRLLIRLFRHPSLLAVEELVVTDTPYPSYQTWEKALLARPKTLRRIEARGMKVLGPLKQKCPGSAF
ncbi:MAG: TIGR02996 domain-containing protein [Myxococcales bacterium]